MSSKVKITCDEATTICDKNQYNEASLWEKIKLIIHSLTCKYCRSYSAQNNILTKVIGNHLKPCNVADNLTKDEKEVIKLNLEKKSEK